MSKKEGPEQSKLRIAIVNGDRCKPKKCKQECKKFCPVVRTGKDCIEAEKDSTVAWISETLCIGCGICAKKCPFNAIAIINLPKDLTRETVHRYGPNAFKLHRLPVPRAGQVLGLVGTNGIGKSTALSILAGKIKPNLGRCADPPDWTEVIASLPGGDLQRYFAYLCEGHTKAVTKPQYVDKIPRQLGGRVGDILKKKDDLDLLASLSKELELSHLTERKVDELSGGELQRFAIALVCIQEADVYMFDEPSSFLDVRQRLQAAHVIRGILTGKNCAEKYIVVVEHDLAVLDYLSDFICCLWGSPGGYGVVTMPFAVREGINIFLDGRIPTENLRFREVALKFNISAPEQLESEKAFSTDYPHLQKKMGVDGFELEVQAGDFSRSEIIIMLGQNGTGKSTFIRMLAGHLKPDGLKAGDTGLPELNVSYKPQNISIKFQGTVRDLFMAKIPDAFTHPQFQADVAKPMLIDAIVDQELQHLSGGEQQRVAIVLTLGKPANIYLIDEPSAYLDAEQRIVAARVIKQFVISACRTAFIVEHDFLMAIYLADRVIVYDGEPGVRCIASAPQSLLQGMNQFLKQLNITFRRDPTNFRPRINKIGSVKDREQKDSGNYFLLEK